MQLAKPRDPAYFRAAAQLLRRLHAANVIHNDLAKETNWLVTPDGRPALVGLPARDDVAPTAHLERIAAAAQLVMNRTAGPLPAHWATTISATCSSTSAATCPPGSRRARKDPGDAIPALPGLDGQRARRSIYSSPAGC
jgi:hypothetical protein